MKKLVLNILIGVAISLSSFSGVTYGNQTPQSTNDTKPMSEPIPSPTKNQLKQINQGNWNALKEYFKIDAPYLLVCCFKSEYERDFKHPRTKSGIVRQYCRVVASNDKNILACDIVVLPTQVEGIIDLKYRSPEGELLFILAPKSIMKYSYENYHHLSTETLRIPLQKGEMTASACLYVKIILNRLAGNLKYM